MRGVVGGGVEGLHDAAGVDVDDGDLVGPALVGVVEAGAVGAGAVQQPVVRVVAELMRLRRDRQHLKTFVGGGVEEGDGRTGLADDGEQVAGLAGGRGSHGP